MGFSPVLLGMLFCATCLAVHGLPIAGDRGPSEDSRPSRVGVSREMSRSSLFEGRVPTVRVLSECFFNSTHCACSKTSPRPGSMKCYDQTGVDDNGRLLCSARDCSSSYQCSCDGSTLCARSSTKQEVIRLIEGSEKFCMRQTVTVSKATVLEGEPVPQETLSATELVAFNQTHCSCSPKASLVGSMTCLEHAAGAGEDENGRTTCSTRDCRIKPSDMLCDLSGSSLCERRSIRKESFVSDGSGAGEGRVFCHLEERHMEEPVCVSSCPTFA